MGVPCKPDARQKKKVHSQGLERREPVPQPVAHQHILVQNLLVVRRPRLYLVEISVFRLQKGYMRTLRLNEAGSERDAQLRDAEERERLKTHPHN